MSGRTIHRIALFIAGMSMLSEVKLIPGIVGLSKPATAFLAVTTLTSLVSSRKTLFFTPKQLWVGLFGTMLAISFVFSMTQGFSYRYLETLALSYGSIIAFYFLVVLAVASIEDASALVWGLVTGGTISSVSVLLGYGASAFAVTELQERTGGLSGDPNYFAMGVTATAMLALYPMLRSRSIPVRTALVPAIGLMIAGSFASLSRGGLLALGVASAFLVYRLIGWGHRIVLIPALLAVLALPFALPTHMKDRLLGLTTSGAQVDGSIQTRLAQYRRAVTLVAGNPLLGVGAGRSNVSEAFGGAISRQDLSSFSVAQGRHHVIHNSFLVVLAEGGLLVFIPYLMIYILSWLELSRTGQLRWSSSYEKSRTIRSFVWLAGLLQAALLGLAIGGLFLSAARFKALWMVFGLSTAVSTLALAQARSASSTGTSSVSAPQRDAVAQVDIAPR